jgi:hypothetical protein
MSSDLTKTVGAILGAAAMSAAAGFAGGGYLDMTGAKAWKEENIKEIEAATRLKDRVRALEAQQAILMKLVSGQQECDP